MKIKGRVWKFGDDVDTDLILPARYLNISDGAELARHCFDDLRPDFAKKVAPGDVVVAGRNFGCGSSREHAPLALKKAGVGAVVAKSFSRIFYRNAFNIGLPLLESEQAADELKEGASVTVDLAAGKITDGQRNAVHPARPIPGFMRNLVAAEGLVESIRKGRPRKRKP